MIARKARWSMDSEGSWLNILVESPQMAQKAVEQFDGDMDVEIKKHRKKRSLNANAYFHLLVNKIADKVGESDKAVKRRMVVDYGTVERDDNGVVGFELNERIDVSNICEYANAIGTVERNGKKFVQYLVYKPSHTLDTKEMSRLIDGVVQEAKNLGMETATPQELSLMIEKWSGYDDAKANGY